MKNPFNYPDDKKQCPWCGSVVIDTSEGGSRFSRYITFDCGTTFRVNNENWDQHPDCHIEVLEFKMKLLESKSYGRHLFKHDNLDDEISSMHEGVPLCELIL